MDKLAWMHTKDGCYSVKSGYWIARDLEEAARKTGHQGEQSCAKNADRKHFIWRLLVPNKIKLFLWRVSSSILPCAEALQFKYTVDTNMCILCFNGRESILHAFWRCKGAKNIWKKVGFF